MHIASYDEQGRGEEHLISALLARLHSEFSAAGIEDPSADAELIIGHVLGETRGRVQALAVMGSSIGADARADVWRIARDRAMRIPLQHLTGMAPFRQLELAVGPGVFIPRPETEIVAQTAIDELLADASPEPLALDLCTGSGAIALSIVDEVPRVRVWAIEKDEHAHAWAGRNVARFGDERVTLLRGDVADLRHDGASHTGSELPALAAQLRGQVSVIVANPPYVPAGAIPREREVHEHDPAIALYSGEDGLDLIRVIARIALPLARPGGLLVIEHAEHQGEQVRATLARHGWQAPATHRDLTLRDRLTTARA